MSLNVTFNGSMYIIPETGEVGWGGNTTSYLVAIAAGALQKTGGSFTLSAELDFGASFGLKSLYYKSRSANIAAAGIVRLNNNSDSINWRNAANSADLALFPNASNLLTFNGSTVYVIGAGTITNADISPSAAIAYSKLNLTNSIVNADINAAAAIDYSKLNVPAGAITYAKLTLTNSIVNADINSAAAIAFTKMVAQTASRMIVSDVSGFHVASAWSYNATDDMTTGPNDELRFQDTTGGQYVAFRAPTAVTTHTYDLPIAAGTAGQVLSWQAGGQLQWINAAGGGTINSGVAGRFSYYPATGTTLSDQTALTTDGSTWVRIPDGSTAVPGLAYIADSDTGFYRSSSGNTRYVANGIDTLGFLNSGLEVTVGVITNRDGTAALPSYTFLLDQDTGIFRPTSNRVGIAASGTESAQFSNDGIQISINGSAGIPSYAFLNDLDTGMYLNAANDLRFTAGGTFRLAVQSGQLLANTLLNMASNVITAVAQISLADGTAGSPSLNFTNDTNTGIYAPGTADRLNISCGGTITAQAQLNAGVAQFLLGSGTLAAPSLCIAGNASHGFYRVPGLDVTGSSVPLAVQFATAAAPGFTFAGDENTGMYRVSSDVIGFATSGSLSFTIDGNTGFINSAFNHRFANGTAASPSITFTNNTNMGMYRFGTDSIGFAVNGVNRGEWNASYFLITPVSGAVSSLGLYGSNVGFTNEIVARNNDGTNANSRAGFNALVASTLSDPYYYCTNQVVEWIWGLDNSDSDNWILSRSSTLGTNNAISISSTNSAVSIKGTDTTDSAAAGFVGQYVSATVNGQNAGTTGQYSDVTSISLTAGDWNVSAFLVESNNGATVTDLLMGISTTTGNSSAGLVPGDNQCRMAIPSAAMSFSNGTVPGYRVSISATTTYYLKNFIAYTVATPQLSGRISARRVR